MKEECLEIVAVQEAAGDCQAQSVPEKPQGINARSKFFTLLLSHRDLFSVSKSSQFQAPFSPALALGFVKSFWSSLGTFA